MAEYGEWNRKGATLSDKTAKKEYGVDHDFIVKGINTGKLGTDRLLTSKNQTELRKIKSEIRELKKRLDVLQIRKTEIENQIAK